MQSLSLNKTHVQTKAMTPRTEEKQLRVADFMSSPVLSVSSETNFVKTIELVVGKRIRNVVVTDIEKFAEKDLLNKVIGQGVDIDEKVGQYSSSPVVTAKVVGIGANEAGRLMFAHKIETSAYKMGQGYSYNSYCEGSS